MPNIEHLIVEPSLEDCGERRPEQADSIIVQMRECKEGKYEAKFRLALTGIVNMPNEANSEESRDRIAWIDDSICALLTSLSDGQILDLNYGWRHQPGKSPEFNWEVVGSSTGAAGTDALEGARDLFHSLQVVLGNPAMGLRFSPAKSAHKEPGAGLNWRYMLEPAAISIPVKKGRRVGYTGAHPAAGQVILAFPPDRNRVDFDSVIRTGGASPASFTVSLCVEGITLNDEELDVVNTAFDHLRTGEVGQIRLEGSRAGRIYDDGIVASTLYRLERWLGDPHGYKVSCTVRADGPLPKSLLEIIGCELFRGVPVSARRITENSDIEHRDTSGIVNLADCFHRADSPLNLLPGMEGLQRVGIPRAYTSAPVELSPKGTVLGYCGQQHAGPTIRLADADRSRHCYVIGATGTGKSTLLYNMISQDIESGQGLCMIDPHGDLYEQLMNSVPKHRAKDVILMDLADLQYAVGINLLECNGPNRDVQMNFVVNELMMIFSRLYNLSIVGGPGFEVYMRNALLAVMDIEGRTATLLDVVRFFEDNEFRRYVKKRSKNVLAVSFWERQAERVKGDWDIMNLAPYITCKLNQFTHNALLRPIIGQPRSTIDFRKAMDQGKIVLVNLAKGLLGEFDARLLGMLLIGKIFNASLSRISVDKSERRPFYLYIDEFQNLATPSVIGLLSEARKFGLSLIMANQHLGQFSEDDSKRGVADAILGNVATMLFFRMGPKDAEKLETYTRPYLSAHDLQRLPDHHVACRMLNNNAPVPSFVFETFPMQAPVLAKEERDQITRNIRRRARRVYARKRETVEQGIMQDWSTDPAKKGCE